EIEGTGHLFLLNDPDVKTDLDLTDEQRQRLDELNRWLGERRGELFHDFRQLSSEERRGRVVVLSRAHEGRAAGDLPPPQMGRLRQLALQMKGLGAFRDPIVIATLTLSPEQQERIKAIEADTFIGPFGPPGGPRTGGGGPMRKGPDGFGGQGPGRKGPDNF